jgi:hypothetical protein
MEYETRKKVNRLLYQPYFFFLVSLFLFVSSSVIIDEIVSRKLER